MYVGKPGEETMDEYEGRAIKRFYMGLTVHE
jgi:hypothetical protein